MSKTENFLKEYLDEYISSAQGSGDIISTGISSPASMGNVFGSLSKFKTAKTPNAFQDFLALQKNPRSLTQSVVMQNSPGFVNAMSMFGG